MKRISFPGTHLSAIPLGLGLADLGIADRGVVIDQLLGQFHDTGGTVLDTAHCIGGFEEACRRSLPRPPTITAWPKTRV